MQTISLTCDSHAYIITLTESDTVIIPHPCEACFGTCVHILTIPDGVTDGFEKVITITTENCRYLFEFKSVNGSIRQLRGATPPQDSRMDRFLRLKWMGSSLIPPSGGWIVVGVNGLENVY